VAVLAAFSLAGAVRAQTGSAETELREGIALTGRGQFPQAIPHFLAARGHVADSFALDFNLALCYVGTRQFADAIRILSAIPEGPRSAQVKNLLTQALVGDRQAEAAWKAFQEAARLAPKNASLYMLVSQACLDEGLYDLGAKVLETGLQNLPDSARLHFQQGVLLSHEDDNERAARAFERAQSLAPGSEIAYIAEAEHALIAGHMPEVIGAARTGIRAGYKHYLLLTMLGEALVRTGAAPGTPEWKEAQTVLEEAVALRPAYSSSHIALGRMYLSLGRSADAVAQLETGRRIDPRNKAAYPPLAAAYQRSGESEKSKEILAALAELNRVDAARMGSARKGPQ
jgi:tetratricopeptide (TPR) repeat protein